MSLSFYIIKPEAFQFRKEVREIIYSSDLNIIVFKAIIIPPSLIDSLYSDCTKEMIATTKYFICNKLCEVGIVSGNNAVKKLLKICGLDPDPNKCEGGTIRYIYGIKQVYYYEGIAYFKNGIHRPKTTKEMKRNISHIKSLLSYNIV